MHTRADTHIFRKPNFFLFYIVLHSPPLPLSPSFSLSLSLSLSLSFLSFVLVSEDDEVLPNEP